MSIRPALIVLSMATTAACGAQNVTNKAIVSDPAPIATPQSLFPQRPAFYASDFNVAVADDTRAALLNETPSTLIPFGSATYDGHVRSGVLVDNETGYDIIGALALNVDINSRSTFADRNPISGTITDVTLIDRFSGDSAEAFAGALDIRGDSTSGEIEATATGTLARESLLGGDQEAAWSIDLDGSFRDDFARADTITGTATGGTADRFRDDYDVELIGNGRFYGEEN